MNPLDRDQFDIALVAAVRRGLVGAFCPSCNCGVTISSATVCDTCGTIEHSSIIYRATSQPSRQ